jgi:hypothetical protein
LHLQEPSLLPAQFPDWSSSIMLKNDQGQGKIAYTICQNYQKDKVKIVEPA